MVHRPERVVGNHGRIGAAGDEDSLVEEAPHRRHLLGALAAPVLDEARAGAIQVVLRRDCEVERLHARIVVGPADEEVLDRPALAADRAVAVRCGVGVEHLIDRGVAHRVRGDAPAEAVQLAHCGDVLGERHDLDSLELAAFAERFLVGRAHVPAFESAVDQGLHSADAQPFVALVGPHVPRGDRLAHLLDARVVEDAHQVIDAKAQFPLRPQLLEHAVRLDRAAAELELARNADSREPGRVEDLHLSENFVLHELRRRRQLHQAPRGVDQLAVQFAVRVVADLPARRHGRNARDVPAPHRG